MNASKQLEQHTAALQLRSDLLITAAAKQAHSRARANALPTILFISALVMGFLLCYGWREAGVRDSPAGLKAYALRE